MADLSRLFVAFFLKKVYNINRSAIVFCVSPLSGSARAGAKTEDSRLFLENRGIERGTDIMKKCAILLIAIMTMTMAFPAFAGKNNTVNDYWYYNDPNKAYAPNNSGSSSVSYHPSFPDEPFSPKPPAKPSIPGGNYGSLGYRTLKRTYPCMRGSDVRVLQTMLNALGYHCGRVDGIFGDRTAAAVRSFQRRNGLKVDGIVGRATKAKLLSRYRNRK